MQKILFLIAITVIIMGSSCTNAGEEKDKRYNQKNTIPPIKKERKQILWV